MYAEKTPSRALAAMFAMCMMATCSAEEIDIQYDPNHYYFINLNFNVVPILITTIMALLLGYWWMGGHLATWTLPTTWWRATGETRAEAEAFQEASRLSRPAPVFADAGVETDIRMGDIVTQMEYVQLVDSIETTYISREDHHRALSDQEAHSRLDAHHRVQSPIYFTQNGCCWHADYFCLRRQAATRIHQREFCTRCCQSLGSAMAPQDWERDL